jgi:hypothetical protein
MASRQVAWWSVYEFVSAVLDQVNDWPMLGTPAWCSLAHDDPRKWAALLDGSRHWALRLEIGQEQRAQASHDISSAADWRRVGTELVQRNAVYIPRRAS